MNAVYREDERVAHLRIPPHSVEAEQAVLGGLMLDPSALDDVADLLQPEDFYRRDHQQLYAAIRELAEKGRPFDTVFLGEWFAGLGQHEMFDRGAYLVELASTTPSAANARAYAEIVQRKAVLRRLIQAGTEIANDAFEAREDDAESVVSASTAKLAAMSLRASGAGGLTLLRSGLQGAWDDMEARYRGEADIGLQMPWPNVVRKLPGLEATDLMVLAARPAMGKTACALQIAMHAAEVGQRAVAFFSLEMGRRQLITRLMALKGRVDMSLMRQKEGLTNEDWAALSDARNQLQHLPLAIDDEASLTVDGLAGRAARMHAKVSGGLGLIVVDYLQLLSGGRKSDSRADEVGYISRSLKKLAKKLCCPVIALSQLNRSLESRTDKRPVMADLRESGAIEQDADVIAFLFRDDYYTKDMAGAPGVSEFIIGKQRQGPTGTAYLTHHLERSAFENYHGPRPDYTPKRAADGSAPHDEGFDDHAPSGRRSTTARSRRDAAAGPDA